MELAFDQGHLATVDAKLDLVEIEIELKHGDPREAARLAKKLARIHRGHVALIKGELHIARLPSAMP
jgi:inorganic triphosphatase YgiF